MKIEKTWTILFDEIHEGQCFEFNGIFYIKAHEDITYIADKSYVRVAVSLKTGKIDRQWLGCEECSLYENAEVKLI